MLWPLFRHAAHQPAHSPSHQRAGLDSGSAHEPGKDTAMHLQMMKFAKPPDGKRLTVIIVMPLNLVFPAHLARRSLKLVRPNSIPHGEVCSMLFRVFLPVSALALRIRLVSKSTFPVVVALPRLVPVNGSQCRCARPGAAFTFSALDLRLDRHKWRSAPNTDCINTSPELHTTPFHAAADVMGLFPGQNCLHLNKTKPPHTGERRLLSEAGGSALA